MLNFPWTSDGWDGRPESKLSSGTEIVYRAYDTSPGSKSGKWGRFFFMPRVAGQNIEYLTADQLELELNAALWGNQFEYLAKFRLIAATPYFIGNVAHDDYSEKDREMDQIFQARSFTVPSGMFVQVFLKEPEHQAVFLSSHPINPGRFARTRPKGWM